MAYPTSTTSTQRYDICVVTKLKHRPFPRQASYHATKQLELVHRDLCGPM